MRWPQPPPAAPAPDPFVTQEEAARRLGVSRRTLRRYVKAGRLRVCAVGVRRDVYVEDVDVLVRERSNPSGIVLNRTTFGMLVREAHMLREQLDDALEILDVRRQRLGLSHVKLVEHYEGAKAENAGKPALLDPWAWMAFLLRLDRGDLEAIATATGADHPWLPFYRLIERVDDATVGTDHWRLAHAARRNVEAITGAWLIERGGGVAAFQAASKP